MMLIINAMLYMLVKYVGQKTSDVFRYLILTLLGPVGLLSIVVCFPICVSVCGVYFVFDCVSELFVECVFYLCG